MENFVSFIPLGGIGDVTKNMYLYEYNNQILIVDCGLGFADETMLGVDLLVPDISYLLNNKKNIAGMVITHGHEDHMGALPFVLPRLPRFPIFASPFTASLANEKLKEYGVSYKISQVSFGENNIRIGPFTCTFTRVTHSVPDTSHIFIRTPVGNFYHGSDFKFDNSPQDGKLTDFEKIKRLGTEKVLCLLSDCLGSERAGHSKSEAILAETFNSEIEKCQGKFIVTTYSSNIARLNQVIEASEKVGRKICFVGRSLIKTKEVAKKLGYLNLREGMEIELPYLKQYPDNKITLIVAGSQGQENSGMARIGNGEHKEVRLTDKDTVIFSSDPIPGNELLVYELIDTLSKKGIRVLYSQIMDNLHVSGHGPQEDLKELISLVNPAKLLPIGGNFRHMAAYRNLAEGLGYKKNDVFFVEDGQEVIFSKNSARLGRKISVRNVYVDDLSGGEVEQFVLRDRQRISQEGIVVVMVEVDSETGQMVNKPVVISRGQSGKVNKAVNEKLPKALTSVLSKKRGRVTDWLYIRRLVYETSENSIFKSTRSRPLVIPVVIEV